MGTKLLLVLDWWVTQLTLRGKTIYLNNHNDDIMADEIEESHIDYEDSKYEDTDLDNTNILPQEVDTMER